MALKATIYKAAIQLSDLDENFYADHELTLARHPSETDERMLVRLLVYVLNAPKTNDLGALEFAKDMWEPDEPSFWQRNLTGQMEQWIEVGQPDERRLLKACGRSRSVRVYSFSSSTSIWWKGVANLLTRPGNLHVWQIDSDSSRELGGLAQRAMRLQVSIQDGAIWVSDDTKSVEVRLRLLLGPSDRLRPE